jgi:putative ABC transport system permease protein
VGQNINLDARGYRVVGVLGPWNPLPRYYDVVDGVFGEGTDVFVPFSTAIGRQIPTTGINSCSGSTVPAPGWSGHLNSECIWIKFWVELPTPAAVRGYRQFLYNYAAEQRRSGRFQWAPHIALRDVREWLLFEKVVPDELRVSTLVAFGFLVVCLINSAGLMLAKFSSREGELGVRRAIGASKGDIYIQCLVEVAVVGLIGGLLGLALTAVGLSAERLVLGEYSAPFAHLNPSMVLMTVALALAATISSSLYPTWRASRVQPAWQLKVQ